MAAVLLGQDRSLELLQKRISGVGMQLIAFAKIMKIHLGTSHAIF